jgi:hypothetical protein
VLASRITALTWMPPLCAKALLPTNGWCSSGVMFATSLTYQASSVSRPIRSGAMHS